MLRLILIGVITLAACSCLSPTIKKPVRTYTVNFEEEEAATGLRNFNYKKEVSIMAEYIEDPVFIPIAHLPNLLQCYSLKTWLTKIKPKLKEGSEFYHDYDKLIESPPE